MKSGKESKHRSSNFIVVLVTIALTNISILFSSVAIAQVGVDAPERKKKSPPVKAPTPGKVEKKPVATGPPVDITNAANWVQIAPGEFLMGSMKGEADEKPIRRVKISRAFEMGKFEVTQAQWQAVMGSNPSGFKGANQPVDYVSWDDAQQFIKKLNGRNDGYIYRLPTEAEWEYACRAGSTEDYAGNLDQMAWYYKYLGDKTHPVRQKDKTHPVGQKKPNAWGLYDMHGNVWEWCQDWYDESYYTKSLGITVDSEGKVTGGTDKDVLIVAAVNVVVDPQGPTTGSTRVIRGGNWNSSVTYLRFARRGSAFPLWRDSILGFRLVRTKR